MNTIRHGCWLGCIVLAGCVAQPPRETPVPVEPPRVIEAPGPKQTPLARQSPEPSTPQLLAYQHYWCDQSADERQRRRVSLSKPDDELELLLLDYCDGARKRSKNLEAELNQVQARRSWPVEYRDYFAWLQWHLDAFADAAAEAGVERRRMQHTIEQLRAIEDDLNHRGRDTVTPP